MAEGKRLGDTLPVTDQEEYYDRNFRTTFEYHITRLLKDQRTSVLAVDAGTALRYSGDLYGLLMLNGIAPQYHYFVMRCNGFSHPIEYPKSLLQIILPPLEEIDDLLRIWMTNHVK